MPDNVTAIWLHMAVCAVVSGAATGSLHVRGTRRVSFLYHRSIVVGSSTRSERLSLCSPESTEYSH